MLIVLPVVLTLTGCAIAYDKQSEAVFKSFLKPSNNLVTTVQITGIGESQLQPDTALISLGVQSQETTARSAVQENSTRVPILLHPLKDTGILSGNIHTWTIRLMPGKE